MKGHAAAGVTGGRERCALVPTPERRRGPGPERGVALLVAVAEASETQRDLAV
ncbi:hypothetical protein STRAU_5083 [Streptomyces aurantiacus JA 4570]|uniref:Uncharacterized protein n=1 Tax=Streptomyces aurantiacus JA 4570 TaxID=1286094 RepID=S3ZDR4_9ACTN|nr:hypothetical protein STRAU_5083 [Streptomyces aurantiacus JA 4570]